VGGVALHGGLGAAISSKYDLSGFQAKSFDASAQAALAAGGFVLVDQPLGHGGIDHWLSFAERGLGLFDITRGDSQEDFLDVGTQTAASGCIVRTALFRVAGALFRGLNIGQDETPNGWRI